MGSPCVQTSSPIKERAQSIPLAASTNEYDESSDSIDDSYIAQKTLVQTNKKQPQYLQSKQSQSLTFKLTPSVSSTKVSQKLASAADDSGSKCKINDILNVRKPLGEINTNTDRTKCVEGLISLKSGNWN